MVGDRGCGRERPRCRRESSRASGGFLAAGHDARANKVRVAKFADSLCAMLLTPGPQIAARKSQEYGCTTRLCTLALQGEINFLNRVRHD